MVLILAALAAAGWVIYTLYFQKNTSAIPADISDSLEFSPFVINQNAKGYTASSYKYAPMEDSTKVFSFVVTLPGGNTVTVSQYPQPPQFNEVADYKAKFLENKSEDTVPVSAGVIHLSRPEKQQQKQIGLMLERGLIVFLNPTANLSKAEWRDVGNALTPAQL